MVDRDEIAKQLSAQERQTYRAYEDADNETNLSVSNDRIDDLDKSLQLDVDPTSGLAETGALQNTPYGNRSPFDIDWAANRGAKQNQTETNDSEKLLPSLSGTENTGGPEQNLADVEIETTTPASAIQSSIVRHEAAPADNVDTAHMTSQAAALLSDLTTREIASSPQGGDRAQLARASDQAAIETDLFQTAGESELEDFTTATNRILAELKSETVIPSTTESDNAGDSEQTDRTGPDDLETEATLPDAEIPDDKDAAPSVSDISAQSAPEDAAFTYDVSIHFSDVDAGDALVYFLDGPDWLNINSQSGQLSGIPQNEDVGTTAFVVRVIDPKGTSVNASFSVTIENTNDRPVVSEISDRAGGEDSSFYFDASAHFTDLDAGDTLVYAIEGPGWLAIDASSGELFGTPDSYDVGAASITVTATDESGETAATTFSLTVWNTNDGPTATLIADQGANEDATFTYCATAHFDDVNVGDVLTFSLTGPDWLTIDAGTGVLSGTPTNDDIGIVSITVVSTDQSRRSASIAFDLSVDNVNDRPSVTDIFDHTTLKDTGFSYDAASHFGEADADDILSFAVNGPDWLSIDPSSGVLSGTPTNDDIGPTLVTVTATDQSGAHASTDFHLAVSNVNDAPAVTAIEDLSATEEAAFAYDTSTHFGDVDSSDVLTFSITGPEWLSIDDVSGKLSGTPTNANVGPTLVTVTATDLFGDSASVDFHVVVDNINDAPTVTTIEDLSTSEDVALSYNASSHFSDGDDNLSSDGNDLFGGGDGPDTILLCGTDGDAPDPSTYKLDLSSGTASLNGEKYDLSADAAGKLTYDDGSSVSFDGVETISWADNFAYDANRMALADGSSENIAGESLQDTLAGGAGNDTIEGHSNEDMIIGAGGDDSLSKGSESDLTLGGDGVDTIGDGTLDDYLFGDVGDDSISSGEGDDYASGGAGVDNPDGDQGDGTFVVIEGKGNDTISGGSACTDVIQVSGSSGSGGPSEPWTVSVDNGDAQTITADHGFLNLGTNRSGIITFDDGTEVTFDGIERIEW